MFKIWNETYWKKRTQEIKEINPLRKKVPLGPTLSSIALCLLLVLVGVFAGPLFRWSMLAAEDIIDPAVYIEAVLGAQ